MPEHISTCFQLEKLDCPVSKTASHNWSGWPGAYCLDCGSEDKNELCLGISCACPCHDEFWAAYERTFAKSRKRGKPPRVAAPEIVAKPPRPLW